jgi:hypothetical protein
MTMKKLTSSALAALAAVTLMALTVSSQAKDEIGMNGRPDDIPADIFTVIRRDCAAKWESDFRMRVYCEDKQIDAYRKLRGPVAR